MLGSLPVLLLLLLITPQPIYAVAAQGGVGTILIDLVIIEGVETLSIPGTFTIPNSATDIKIVLKYKLVGAAPKVPSQVAKATFDDKKGTWKAVVSPVAPGKYNIYAELTYVQNKLIGVGVTPMREVEAKPKESPKH